MKRGGSTVVAAVLVWAAPATAQQSGAGAAPPPRRFVADAATRTMKVYPGSGLNAPFTREAGILTIDPDGTQAPEDKPRVDGWVHLAAVPAAYSVVPNEVGGMVLASGLDHDGTTELLLYLASQHHQMVVYGDGIELARRQMGEPEIGPNSLQAQNLPAGTKTLDLLSNPPWSSPGEKALSPASAVSVHGAIIVAGPVWVRQPSMKYELMGWGFAMSQDRGVNWNLEWDSVDLPQVQPYLQRGERWCLRAAPIYQRGQIYPTSCVIVSTDYIHRTWEPPPPPFLYEAYSGRVFYFRITRPPQPEPSVWTLGANTTHKVKVFDLSPPYWPNEFKPLNHAHSCMATEWTQTGETTPGVQVVVSIGDTRTNNRFIRFTAPNYAGDYTTTPWGAQEDYHGVAGPWGPDTVSSQSPQPATSAFGANPGEVLWGTDLFTEWLMRMRLPLTSTTLPDQARFDHLYGLATGFGKNAAAGSGGERSRPLVFSIAQPRPEAAAGPLTAVYTESGGLGGEELDANRVLYCPDSSKPGEWAQAAAFRATPPATEVTAHTAAPHAGSIWFAGLNHGLKTRPIPSLTPVTAPTLMKIRPLLVGPGGKNLVKGGIGCYFNDEAPEPPATLTQLTQVSALPPVWADGPLTLPAVPSLGNRALKIRTTRGDSNGYYARARVSSDNASDWNNLPPGYQWLTGTEHHVRRFRGWVLDGSYNQIAPNKTNEVYLRLWDEDPNTIQAGAVSDYSCLNRWAPITNISARPLTPGRALGLRFNAFSTGINADTEENYGYFVVGEALDGNGSLPYPMQPEADGEDELLTISNVNVTSEQRWSVKLAGMMPIANWDHYAARGMWNPSIPGFESNRRWPLFTLWADMNNWVEFSADCENKGFLLRVRANGGDPTEHPFGDGKQIWLPDSPLLVAIGYSHTLPRKLYVGASLGGDLVNLGPDGIPVGWSGTTFTELRFRGAAPGGVSGQGEVCEFRWIGGEIIPNSALTNTTLPGAFADLGFLYVP